MQPGEGIGQVGVRLVLLSSRASLTPSSRGWMKAFCLRIGSFSSKNHQLIPPPCCPPHWSFLGRSWCLCIPWSVQRNSRVTGLGLICLPPERVCLGILALHFALDLFINVLPV